MSFGMRIWGDDGRLQLDENSFTMRVVRSEVVSFGSSREIRSFSVHGCHPGNAIAIVIPLGAFNSYLDRQFETEMGNDVAYVANYMRYWEGGRHTSTGSMRLIVMRFN